MEVSTDKLIGVLQQRQGDWFTRSQIASCLGKEQLNTSEKTILALLAAQGHIQERLVPTKAPSGHRLEYRVDK